MSRDHILHKVRTALGRSAGEPPEPLDPPRLRPIEDRLEDRIRRFSEALENLGGTVHQATSAEGARAHVAALLRGKTAVASNAPFLAACGISGLEGVAAMPSDERELRALCARVDVGITSAAYALADTGSLVLFAGEDEPRMISLLPPVHVAILPKERVLGSLDELFTLVPLPGERASSMVLITGPSRTADIEQILIRGVHGPGEICVVLV
jgi:L-lactate dehydrogenase complex protein LldG